MFEGYDIMESLGGGDMDIMALFEWGGLEGQTEADLGKKNAKTLEEIESFVIDESLSESERASLLLKKGHRVQRLSVLNSFENLFDSAAPERSLSAIVRLIDPILASDSQKDDEREAAATSLRTLLAVRTITATALSPVTKLLYKVLSRCRTKKVLHLCADILLSVLPSLRHEEIDDMWLPLAKKMGQVSEAAPRREVCCRLLGRIATILSPDEVESQFFKQAMGLCQDTEATVRKVMCQQLPHFAKAVSPELVASDLVGELLELLNDEEITVKVSAIEVLPLIRPMISTASFTEYIQPVLSKVWRDGTKACTQDTSRAASRGTTGAGSGDTGDGKGAMSKVDKAAAAAILFGIGPLAATNLFTGSDASRKDAVSPLCQTLGDVFGALLLALVEAGDVSPSSSWSSVAAMMNFYETLSKHGVALARQRTAFQLPAVATALGAGAYKDHLHRIVDELAHDEDVSVRRTAAAGLHHIARILSPEDIVGCMKPLFIHLIADDSKEVVGVLVEKLDLWLRVFTQPGDADLFDEVVPAIVEAVSSPTVTTFWRRQLHVLAAWRLLPFLCPEQSTQPAVLAVVQLYLDDGSQPVRLGAVHTMVWLSRFGATGVVRQKMQHQLLTTAVLCGSSWWRRRLFVDACAAAVWLFSRSFVKTHYLTPVLSDTEDNVACIRARAVAMLPYLRIWLKFPKDAEAISRLRAAASAAIEDNNDQVAATGRRVVEELGSIESKLADTSQSRVASLAAVNESAAAVLAKTKSFDMWMQASAFLCCPFNPIHKFRGVGIDGDHKDDDSGDADLCAFFPPPEETKSGAEGGVLASVSQYKPCSVFGAAGAHDVAEEKDRVAQEEELVKAAAREAEEDSRRTMEQRRQDARERAAAQSEAISAAQRARSWELKRIRMGLEPRGGPPGGKTSGKPTVKRVPRTSKTPSRTKPSPKASASRKGFRKSSSSSVGAPGSTASSARPGRSVSGSRSRTTTTGRPHRKGTSSGAPTGLSRRK